jgi:hypothetical protein
MANVVAWRVLTAHGRLLFDDLGFAPAVAAAILGTRVGVSAFGRMSGALCDYVAPTRVMAIALAVNGLGLGGLLFADTAAFPAIASPQLAYLCVLLLGVGYGAGYTSEPMVFAVFFGPAAFVGTTGLRLVLIGIAGWVAPTLAGAAADRTGSYAGALVLLALGCFAGAAAIAWCRPPAERPATPTGRRDPRP